MHNWKHLDDDGKLKQRYYNKRVNARKEGFECKLSFDEYCSLVEAAGLKSSDLGYSGKKYVLARFGDHGDYVLGNCRFILQSENAAERKISDKAREASRHNVVSMQCFSSKERSQFVRASAKWQASCARRRATKVLRQAEKQACKDPRYSGEHNSSFGSHWITNGISNTKWRPADGPIPDWYRLGRMCGLAGPHKCQ